MSAAVPSAINCAAPCLISGAFKVITDTALFPHVHNRHATHSSLRSVLCSSQTTSTSTEMTHTSKPGKETPGGAGSILSTDRRLQARMLHLEWRVEPSRIAISQTAEGRYILLGSGGFGTASSWMTGLLPALIGDFARPPATVASHTCS